MALHPSKIETYKEMVFHIPYLARQLSVGILDLFSTVSLHVLSPFPPLFTHEIHLFCQPSYVI